MYSTCSRVFAHWCCEESLGEILPDAMVAAADTLEECFCFDCGCVTLRCLVSSIGRVFWQCSQCGLLLSWQLYMELHGVPSGNIAWDSPPPSAPGSVSGEEPAAPSSSSVEHSSTEACPVIATAVARVDSQVTLCHICLQELHMQLNTQKNCQICLHAVHALDCCSGSRGCWKFICE